MRCVVLADGLEALGAAVQDGAFPDENTLANGVSWVITRTPAWDSGSGD
jgi:hypothetical protein